MTMLTSGEAKLSVCGISCTKTMADVGIFSIVFAYTVSSNLGDLTLICQKYQVNFVTKYVGHSLCYINDFFVILVYVNNILPTLCKYKGTMKQLPAIRYSDMA